MAAALNRGDHMYSSVYPVPGIMQMPAGFKYKDILRRGRPRHEKYDSFWLKHPPMSPSRWAKIFAPFDALDGFDERIDGKKVVYCERKDLDESEKEELNRKLRHLYSLSANGRLARMNAPSVSITFFHPCADIESSWYQTGGQYKTVRGTVLKVEDGEVKLGTEHGEKSIAFDDIREIDEICAHDITWNSLRS